MYKLTLTRRNDQEIKITRHDPLRKAFHKVLDLDAGMRGEVGLWPGRPPLSERATRSIEERVKDFAGAVFLEEDPPSPQVFYNIENEFVPKGPESAERFIAAILRPK